MRMYVLPSDFRGTERYTVVGKDVHYLTKVLRLSEGMQFTGRDFSGALWDLTIESVHRNSCTLLCAQTSEPQALTDALPEYRGPFPEIHLYQAVCKGKKMDQIVRQATELGVTRIVPVTSERSLVDMTGKEDDRRIRYEKIVKEAVQQSGSLVVTTIGTPIKLDQVSADWGHRGPACMLHQVSQAQQRTLAELTRTAPIALVIGPEGGFSESEVQMLIREDFHPVLLKTNILRAETAAIAAVAIVQHLLVEKL